MSKLIVPADQIDALTAEFARSASEHDRTGAFPFGNFERLREAGLLALTGAREYGGRGAGLGDALAVVGGIARGEPSTALVLTMQYINLATLHRRHWPAPLAERVVRDAATRGALINAFRVEPGLGTPLRGGLPDTIARRDPGGWRISGHKIYSTGAPALTWATVWARTDEAEPRVGAFLVAMPAPGIRIAETWDQLGMRATASHDVLFDNVAVPGDHAVELRLPAAWGSGRNPDQAIWTSVLLAGLYDGIARAAQAWTCAFLRERAPANLGAPLATVPRVQHAVGEIEQLLAANRRLLQSAAGDYDDGRGPAESEAALLKVTVTENAIAIVERAIKLTGNHGLSLANPLERHYRDVLCGRIHSPQEDTVRIAAGRAALGIIP